MSLRRSATLATALAVGLATHLVAPTAHAGKRDNATIIQTVEGSDIVRLLEEAGHSPELKADDVGDPMIVAKSNGISYLVLFYDCTDHKACKAIQYRAWFQAGGSIPVDRVNEWNRTKTMGRAYLDSDKDPTIEHYIRLHGGVTPAHLREQRDWFSTMLSTFRDHLSGS